jgi:hypothetical protein
MDNSYFLFADKSTPIIVHRFHLCTWEFKNDTALIEFGCEIDVSNCNGCDEITLDLFVPWLTDKCVVKDLYNSLKDSANSKFIFNDSIKSVIPLDDGQNLNGVIHEFASRNILCILPVSINILPEKKILEIKLDLSYYNRKASEDHPHIYFRFYLEPLITAISTRKTGISKSTIIYDIKINERRNLPEHLYADLHSKDICIIKACFCLNVIPNCYELTFLDSVSLKNVRTLEYDSFNRYLQDKRVEKDELLVVFNKKVTNDNDKIPSYTFFSIFYKERIGAGQFALALMINLVCGILLFFPTFRIQNNLTWSKNIFFKLPFELYIAVCIDLLLVVYFIWPGIRMILKSVTIKIKNIKD